MINALPDGTVGRSMVVGAARLVTALVLLAVVANALGIGQSDAYLAAASDPPVVVLSQPAEEINLTDTVVIFNSRSQRASDVNFRKVSDYYGLKWAQVDVSRTNLLDSHFRDEWGKTLRAAHVDLATLRGMSAANLDVLKRAVVTGGLNLLITGINGYSAEVASLTDWEVSGASVVSGSAGEYVITNGLPDLTRQFSGQTVAARPTTFDAALNVAGWAYRTDVLVQGTDAYRRRYPLFARYRAGNGSVFLQATTIFFGIDSTMMADLYFAWRNGGENEYFVNFAQLLPMMMVVRFAGGDEAWHSNRRYANLTVDDPPLTQPFWLLPYTTRFYTDLLAQMRSRNFHTTIAFVPANYLTTQPAVAQLFRDNPDRYSLAVHGNNHACPEFPAYLGQAELQRRANEALWRMSEHERRTGIPYGKAMIFPCEQNDLEAYRTLRRVGFDATINTSDVPGGVPRPRYWDYHMYQADLDYASFPSIPRAELERAVPIHDLFIDRPALFFVHADFFRSGMGAFNRWADKLNALPGGVEWRSLDYIVKHLYQEKVNDDQSVSVRFYIRNVFVKNASGLGRIYRLQKKEALDLPIAAVRANGVSVPYRVSNGVLRFDLYIPAWQEVEVTIDYGGGGAPVPTATPARTPTASPVQTPTSTRTASPPSTRAPSPTPTATTTPVSSGPWATWTGSVASSADDAYTISDWTNSPSSASLRIGANGAYDAGFRFANVAVPRGSTIRSARLKVRNQMWSWGTTSATIYAEATGNALDFGNVRQLVDRRPKTVTSTLWSQSGIMLDGTWYTLPDIAPSIQEVINRPDWQSGNAIAVLLRGGSGGYRQLFAYDAGRENAAQLVVEYATPTGR